jgi:hypothetical protein
MDKPVIMETESKANADKMMVELQYKSQTPIDINRLIDVRVETPIIGISKKKRKGVDLVWVGKDFTQDGWIPQEEYDRINNLNKK